MTEKRKRLKYIELKKHDETEYERLRKRDMKFEESAGEFAEHTFPLSNLLLLTDDSSSVVAALDKKSIKRPIGLGVKIINLNATGECKGLHLNFNFHIDNNRACGIRFDEDPVKYLEANVPEVNIGAEQIFPDKKSLDLFAKVIEKEHEKILKAMSDMILKYINGDYVCLSMWDICYLTMLETGLIDTHLS